MLKFATGFSRFQMKKFLFILLLSGIGLNSHAQRYCYVDTKYILENMPEYAEAQNELNRLSEKWQSEIEERYRVIENMRNAYLAEKVLLTPEMKRQREEEILQAEKEAKELQKKRFGLKGDLFKKREELIKPIQDKIYKALVELAESGNYMVIFDKSNESSIIFASPKYDKSDRILKKMGIKPGQAKEKEEEDKQNDNNRDNNNNNSRNNSNQPGRQTPSRSGGSAIKKG